jgi:hypothetical protein
VIPLVLREKIRQNPLLKPMGSKVYKFAEYLDRTKNYHIINRSIKFMNMREEDGNPLALETDCGYDTRWSDDYRKNLLWRLYNLAGYYQMYPDKMPKYSMMITLTGSHDGKDGMGNLSLGKINHIQWNEKLFKAKPLYRWMVNKWMPKNEYLCVWEGHPSSGFSHIHNEYFLDELPGAGVCKRLKEHWSLSLKMGSLERSLDIKFKDVKDFKDIISLVAYPMAYLGKNTSNSIKDWTEFDWVYNASIFWSSKPKMFGGIGHHIRTFQPSRGLSEIMKRSYIPGEKWVDYGKIPSLWIDTRLKMSEQKIYNFLPLNQRKENYESCLEYWEDNLVYGG